MNWGNRIVLSFVVFVMIITTMVVISMKQDIFLVSEDYYDQEIKYQTQIDKMNLASADNATVTVKKLGQTVKFDFSKTPHSGEILFYRPSDATKDFSVDVLKEKSQFIDQEKLSSGLWKIKVSWNVDDKAYYSEKTLII